MSTPTTPAPDRFTRNLLFPDKVSDLLLEHRTKVDEVLKQSKSAVQANPSLEEAARRAPLDDLYALRFLLSAKNNDVSIAVDNLVKTLEWRSTRLDLLEEAAKGKTKHHETITKYSKVALIGLLADLHPVVIVRAGRSNTKGLFDELSFDEILEDQLLRNEHSFALCDAKTRETGFLCKQIAVIDLEGFSIFHWDSKFSKIIGRSSSSSAIYYPQLLGKAVIINMPLAFRMIFRAMSVFMPASAIEKQAVCPANTLKKSASECPFLKKFPNGVQIMPPFLGGTGEMLPEFVLEDHK